jgi:quinol monooxygenase YgiN
MILINVILTCKPGAESRFKQLLLDTMAASGIEPGCVEYRMTADLVRPDTFYLMELWSDEAAVLAHVRGAVFGRFIAELPAIGGVVRSVAYKGELSPYQVPR